MLFRIYIYIYRGFHYHYNLGAKKRQIPHPIRVTCKREMLKNIDDQKKLKSKQQAEEMKITFRNTAVKKLIFLRYCIKFS